MTFHKNYICNFVLHELCSANISNIFGQSFDQWDHSSTTQTWNLPLTKDYKLLRLGALHCAAPYSEPTRLSQLVNCLLTKLRKKSLSGRGRLSKSLLEQRPPRQFSNYFWRLSFYNKSGKKPIYLTKHWTGASLVNHTKTILDLESIFSYLCGIHNE